MKTFRNSFVTLALSSVLSFSGLVFQGVACYRQGHVRTHEQHGRRKWSHHPATLANLTMNCDARAPVVSFALNKNGVSGGFGDRLRGMVTTYYLAIVTNSSFRVDWTQPYNLSDYFSVPNCHERVHVWTKNNGAFDRSRHENDRGGDHMVARSSIDVWNYFTDSLFLNDVGKDLEITTNSFHWKEIVQNRAFKVRAASLGLSDRSQAELFRLAVDNLLGNPTGLVTNAENPVLRRLAGGYEPNEFGPTYVGVQIRLGGGAVTGWQDPARHSMHDVQCFAKEAVRLCRLMHIRSIFVTADSDEAVRSFEEGVLKEFAASATFSLSPPIVVQVPGVIAHTDRSKVAEDQSKDIWLKSILDWWLLKQASALVVSRSGFGETAAMASDASLALRLKLSSAEGTSLAAGGSSRACEFEDLLLGDRDVFQ